MTPETGVVEVSVLIEAQPETVFPYFTDPARYAQWMGERASLDPKPGGEYRISLGGGLEAVGEFVEVSPPHRVVFTFGWTGGHDLAPGSSRVVVTLAEEGVGTRVVVRHHDLPSAEQCEQHAQGWRMYLDRLAMRVHGEDPGPDPHI
ncbi:MAG: SRPBCC domain-containing protein [Mycobacteriales bacterium]